MAVKVEFEFFWVVTLCSVMVGYKCFGGPCCHHLHNPEDFDFNSNLYIHI
jgi:hypothetical protein